MTTDREPLEAKPGAESPRCQTLYAGEVTPRTAVGLESMNAALVAAVDAAKNASVPQGLIVALLHGHAHQQTAVMMGAA